MLADLSHDFARGTADISDRQNIQYHWIRVEDVPEIWRRLEAVGLQTTEACGDTPRVVLGSPLAGIAADEIIDPTPVIDEITGRFIGDPELANLPRKFKSAITGHPSLDVVHEINDISLVGVVHPELGVGYDLWVGGGLSTAPRLAERLGVFVAPEQAADVWLGVISIFRDYGYRRLRTKARLKFLMAEWGPEKFREVLETEYLGHPLPDGPPPAPATRPRRPRRRAPAEGRPATTSARAPVVGRISGDVLTGLADLMAATGTDRVRLTPHQKLVVLDVPPDARRRPRRRPRRARPVGPPQPVPPPHDGVHRHRVLQARHRRDQGHRRRRPSPSSSAGSPTSPTSSTPRSPLNVNGCPNSCARIQVADIGLKGQIVTIDGEQEPGFQVHLGGGLASADRDEAGLGRTVRGLKVTAADLPDYVERVVRRLLAEREAGETFSTGPTAPTRRSSAMTAPPPPPTPTATPTAPRARRSADELEPSPTRGAREPSPERHGRRGRRLGGLRTSTAPSRSPARWRMPCCRTSSSRLAPGVDVLFLDTGYHFAETSCTRDRWPRSST